MDMIFISLDDCYSMYVTYAKACGFSVRKGTGKINAKGERHIKYYLCTRVGLYKDKKVDTLDPSQKERIMRSNFSKRTDCGALLCVIFEAGSWKVYKFVKEHNHDLVELPDKHFVPTEWHLTQLQKHVIHMSKLNLGPVKAFNVMKTFFGGFEDVGASKLEFKNYKRQINLLIGEYDAEMVVGVRLCNSTNFKERIYGVVWTDILAPEVFESGWEEFIREFNLADNDWLPDIFELRESWIPAYYRMEELSGLMRTTSRSESENHFFGQVCNSKATLVEFMTHYETAIEAQRHMHRKNDHESRYKRPQLKSNYQVLEGQAADIYTENIFCDVQAELIGIADCINQRYEDQPDGLVKFYINDFQQPFVVFVYLIVFYIQTFFAWRYIDIVFGVFQILGNFQNNTF
ncbi:protein FAR1-RELATED SEQUENCE 5-like [Helianthus annuus]|uniref:protein FAR1-RELATED SEQUENCE 5-like n=1 Tax=Helianthus annuus TaxID=4232 RepID=UPI0016532835|nr:protein FAR1-RELATED SEQUENCE 5-like [Helianthus annuus]